MLVATLDEAAELRAVNHILFELPIVTTQGCPILEMLFTHHA